MGGITEIFAEPNLPATALLILVIVYWSLAALAGLDLDFLELDLDLDTEADLPGADGIEGGTSVLNGIFLFFYLGRIPVMILATVFALIHWMVTLIATILFNPTHDMTTALYLIPAVGVVSLLITKVALWPTLGFFDSLDGNNAERPNRLLGLHGLVTSTVVDEKFGQVTIEQNGPPIVLNVYCGELDRFKKGDAVTIVEYNPAKNTYLIAPYAEKK